MRHRRPALIILFLLSVLSMGFGPPVLTSSDFAHKTLTRYQLSGMRTTPLPQLTAAAVLLADNATGEIIYATNERERRAPASLVKLVTAMVALEHGRLDQQIIVSLADVRVWSVARVQNGEQLSLRDLLFIMLIPSDNVAARVIARGLGGNTRTFVGWMNEMVARWGLEDTHFANPSGLDHDDGYSTAFDMAVIARHAMMNPVIADIVRRSEAFVAGHWIESTNILLNSYSGMVGIKTGTEERAGECLITMVDRPAGKALTVILGSEDRFADTYLLLEYFYSNYTELRVDLPVTDQNRYLDESNDWRGLGLAEPLVFLVRPWQSETVKLYRRIEQLGSDPNLDTPIGSLEVSLAGEPFTEVALYAR